MVIGPGSYAAAVQNGLAQPLPIRQAQGSDRFAADLHNTGICQSHSADSLGIAAALELEAICTRHQLDGLALFKPGGAAIAVLCVQSVGRGVQTG